MVRLINKCCTRCKNEKPLFDFSDHPHQSDGKQSQCKSCFAERARLKRIGKPCMSCGKPKEIGVSKGARICLSCSETCFECKKNPRRKQHRNCSECQAKKDKERNRLPERQSQLRITRITNKYKVTREAAKELANVKNCMCCDKEFTSPRDRHVDHCHKTGKVRGVLCFNCNASLGHINDDQIRLAKLIGYLSKHQNGIADLEKAKHYIELLIEMENAPK